MTTENLVLGILMLLTGGVNVGMSIPLLYDKVKMNQWYGMRTKKSFESEENWYRINRYGARLMIWWSIPLFVAGVAALFLPLRGNHLLTIAIVLVPFVLLVPCIQIRRFARKL